MVRKYDRGHASVRITAGAERDLAGIYDRRLVQRGADGTDGAEALLDELVAAIIGLADFSHRGPVPPELEVLGIHTYRQLSHPPYRIIYLPDEHEGEMSVTIVIVADGRRDFRVLLEERLLRGER
jgi:plasmid stabilization system protein ParE